MMMMISLPTRVTGFAAAGGGGTSKRRKGNNNKKKKANAVITSSSRKGFGIPPPTFDEVVATFPTRYTPEADQQPCPCGITSNQTYAECCAPYHQGLKVPSTPLEVLQTRYTAFYFRHIPYIIQTTHPVCRDYTHDKIKWAKDLDQNGMFDSFEFVSLEPLSIDQAPNDEEAAALTAASEDSKKEAFLEFQVTLRAKHSDPENQKPTTVIWEKSRFLKNAKEDEKNSSSSSSSSSTAGRGWLYAGGEVRSKVLGLQDTILNQ
jgi:SEC-C motif-containing protein